MNNSIKIAFLAFLAVLVVTALSSLFIVKQTEQAIVLQFGKFVREVPEAGLHAKLPFIQNVVYYDKRLLEADPPAEEVLLKDQKRIVVDTFARFQIVNPLTFYQSVLTEDFAKQRLSDAIISSLRDVLSNKNLTDVLSPDREQIMKDIKELVDSKTSTKFGVKMKDVRIRRADLPQETSLSIYARMRSEREQEAKGIRAEGTEQAQKRRAEAEKDRTVTLANATKTAETIRGEGDKEATRIWSEAAAQDKEFYAFYRSLNAYKEAMKDGNTSMVLSPNSEFFRYFGNLPK